jgi:asparaginyl-tRNA synthetase
MMASSLKRLTIKNFFSSAESGRDVLVKGWIRTQRVSKNVSFIMLYDGSTQQQVQIVVDQKLENFAAVSSLLSGSSVAVTGKVVEGPAGKGAEIHATHVHIYGEAPSTFPLQKKATSLEFLREVAHLRPRTQLFGAINRIRHQMAMSTHRFFDEQGFFYANTPIVTAQDAEGAGEMFTVTTLPVGKGGPGEVDFSKDYFGKKTHLTVSGQMEGECLAMGLGAIYTFGPTFRSENSNTTRHLSEFWMIEPEVAFATLEDNADLAEAYVKRLIGDVLLHNHLELDFLQQWHQRQDPQYTDRRELLKHVASAPFQRVSYTEAVNILLASGKKFEFPVAWGLELQSEHERFLCEEHFKAPTIVMDYPKECKAFYMKLNDDGKTVRAMDVLVPGIGEIIGGSQREDNLELMIERMEALKMDVPAYWWYNDLRRFGNVPHAGFGLGFERAIMYVTGMSNIRDVIPFPRSPRNADF